MTKAKSSGEESRSKPDGASGRNTKGNTPKKMETFRKNIHDSRKSPTGMKGHQYCFTQREEEAQN
jgi:hypothetical protein